MKPWKTIEYTYDESVGLYRKTQTSQVMPFVAAFADDATVARLRALLPCPCVRVRSSRELSNEAAKPGAVVFIDWDLLCHVDVEVTRVPIVAITDARLPRLIRSLDAYPWLSHYLADVLLDRPTAKAHLARLLERIVMGTESGMLGEARVALLAQASYRGSRFERIRMFFNNRGISGRAIERIHEVYEELVTNALYDAPLEAGYFQRAVPRTKDVELPSAHACEISYGLDQDTAFIRVRDTFGAFSRSRMLSVLERCSREHVALDESRGGAGLGLWRVFSAASSVSIKVEPGKVTEILIGISTKGRRDIGPIAVDLAFASNTSARRYLASEADPDLDNSITLIRCA